MTNTSINRLAQFLMDEKRDIKGMKEGKLRIDALFEDLDKILIPGMSYGKLKEICYKKLFPNREIILQIIPENIPYHNESDAFYLKEGEFITVDCAIKINREWADGAITLGVGNINPEKRKFIEYSKDLFNLVKKISLPDHNFNHIIKTIQKELKHSPYFLVPDCGGHGIGRSLHQGDDYIYSHEKSDLVFPANHAYTIEPVIGVILENHKLYSYFEETIINE